MHLIKMEQEKGREGTEAERKGNIEKGIRENEKKKTKDES